MHTTNIAKSVLSKVLFAQSTRAVYSSAGFEKPTGQRGERERQRKSKKQLKPYQKLFFSSPLMNINIEMIMAINQLRPKATYIIASKNGLFPKQISNSTYNIIECLYYIQGFRYFYKSFPALVQNMSKILTDKIEFSFTGLHKANAIKKFIHMLSTIDSLYGEIFTQLVSVYLIWAMQSSLKIKRKLVENLAPLKQRLTQINDKKKALLQGSGNDESKLSQIDKQTLSSLNGEISFIEDEKKKLIYQSRFLKQQDFLCGLHYCLQRGYYSETILRQFVQNILERDNYTLPEFEYFLKDEEEFFYEKPLSDIYNKKALIYCRMYSGAVYRIKILNELKKLKRQDGKFMDFLKQHKGTQQNKQSESSSQESPFINGVNNGIEETSQSSSDQKAEYLSDKLIEQSLISKKGYTSLVNKYIEMLERKDVLCYIMSEQVASQSFRVLETEFFSYLNDASHTLTISDIKTRYMNVFKEIFDIEKNGTLYVQSPFVQASFEVVLRMYDYGDRKEVFELLKLYQRYLVTKNMSQLKSVAPFYLFQKYHYKSNFVASKLFEYINFKYRLGKEEFSIKEELILMGNQICRYLSLYFKLLEVDLSSMSNNYDFNFNGMRSSKMYSSSSAKVSQSGQQTQNKELIAKHQQQFSQAVEIFLNHYNKIISVIYLERESSGFIGKGLELSFEFMRLRYLNTKAYEQNLYVDGKAPQQDIRKIIIEANEAIKSHRDYVKNVYEKDFQTKIPMKSATGTDISTKSVNYNPYTHSLWLKKSAVLNPLDQVSAILDIVETAVQLQTMKNMEYYEDVMVVFKNIFENKKLVSLISQQQTFPEILKKLIRISQLFKGSYKNESNKLFESILNLTSFNLNNFIHNARINIAREIINADKSVGIDERFQPYLQNLQLNLKPQKNIRIWQQPTYQIRKQTVVSHIRSDIIHTALTQNFELQKIIRDQLAKIKTIKPNERIKNIKFQLNYLQYPYLANVAINKNNELIVVLVRKVVADCDKAHNAVLTSYYEQCESYFKKKGNKVIVVTNQTEIRNSLRDLTK